MLITTEVTEKDYRALQWSVLIDRAKLHLGVFACLPLAAFLLWFFRGADEAAILPARVFAFIIGGVGLLLLAIIAGAFFSRNKLLGGKPVPLGPHTYEVSEKSLSVTSDQRRMEFPVTSLRCVTVTSSHFFVVPRQGTDLIIPRRGLNAEQTEALITFGDAVNLSATLIDRFLGQKTIPVEDVARSFAIMRWSSLAMIFALPFAFGHGPISAGSLVRPAVFGVLFLVCMLLAWRSRKQTWYSMAFCLVVLILPLSRRGEGLMHDGQIYQWALTLYTVAGLPLLLFPRFFRRLIRIPETAAPAQQSASVS
ncbi:YcxB family protein [Roseimicrobium sp. ORNL1]|uniref:YcxB family protein n=1 Tax=Roseimicrobium sp. ORNL1 TaxID=2711231 RepID=UPI0013E14063|nr:YcxB family protein [Roseimicrobium sp. ORNL1]QIF02564.1 YcxB family protein [Roseimicrobium sp. ORNL1]